jgi:putative hemolysin
VVNQKNPSETTELVVSKPGVKVPKQEERLVFGHLSNSMQNLRASERNHSLYSSSSVHRPQRVLAYPNEDRVSNGSPHQPTAEEQENNSAFVFCAPSGGSLTPVKLRSGSVGSTVHHFGLPSPTAFVPAVLREELSRAPIPVYFKNSSSMRGWSLLNYSVECGKTGNLNGFFTILLSLIKCQLAFLSHTPIIIGPEIVRIGVEGKSVLLNVCDSNDKLTSLSGFYQMLVDALLLFRSSIKQSHLPHTIVENCMCVLGSLLSAAQTHRTLDVIRTLLLSNL